MTNDTFSEEEINDFHKKIGENVKRLRMERGMSQLDLSYAMGYSSTSLVSAAEIGLYKTRFSLTHIYKISQIFEVEPSTILQIN